LISVYNTEKYLSACIHSVINQTLKEIEIIIVNDGSTGDELRIIREFQKKDPRIIVFNIENKGVSHARNLAFQNAKGKYVIFIDSDDFLEHSMLSDMYNAITKTKSDFAVCNLRRIFNNNAEAAFLKMPKEKIIDFSADKPKLLHDIISGKIELALSVSNKLYNTDFLKSTHLIFEDRNDIYAEDAFFYFKTLAFIKRACIIDKVLYNYCQREGSVSYSYKENLLVRCGNFISQIERYYSYIDLQKAIADRGFYFLIEILYNEAYHKKGYKPFKDAVKNKFFAKKTKYVDKSNLSTNQRMIYVLYRLKMYILIYLIFYFYTKRRNVYGFNYCKTDN
jgi:glycosyltransferase EpsH